MYHMLMDIGIAGLIVAFSSGITYGMIQWFRRSVSKRNG